mmetsp:Transcript_16442/g.47614  ORF Transcript_16442/g.47614 Transcript_16442/m.47614 type:complete len:242 (-) Transcript_16442:163-888(-)
MPWPWRLSVIVLLCFLGVPVSGARTRTGRSDQPQETKLDGVSIRFDSMSLDEPSTNGAELPSSRPSVAEARFIRRRSQRGSIVVGTSCEGQTMARASVALGEERGPRQMRVANLLSKCYERSCPGASWCANLERQLVPMFRSACIRRTSPRKLCQGLVSAACDVRRKMSFMPEECAEWWSKKLAEVMREDRIPYSRLSPSDLAFEAEWSSMKAAVRPYIEAWASKDAAAEGLPDLKRLSIS